MSSSSSFAPLRKRQRTTLQNPGGNLRFDMGPAYNYQISPRPRIRAFRKGFNRTGGFYGRFRRGGELKFLDTAISLANIAVGTGALSGSLVVIPQADTESGRDGRQVIVKKLSIKGHVITDAAVLGQERVRILLIQDKQTNGALGTIENILETNDINAFRNLENIHRFVVLKDMQVRMPPKQINTAATTSMIQCVPFSINTNLNIPIDYDSSATTGAIATQRSNGLFLIALTFNTNQSDITATCRIRFQDK